MCKWVFKQVTQVRHLSLSHQFWRRCLQKAQRLHGVQDTTEAQRGKDRPANNGVFFVSEDAPHALACSWPWADLPGGGQDQIVSSGQPQGQPFHRPEKASELPRRQGGELPSDTLTADDKTPDIHTPAHWGRGVGGPSETWRQLSACFLDDIPCISSPRINLGHGYQLRTQSRLGWWGVGGTTPESIGRFLWLGYRVWTDYHSGSEWPGTGAWPCQRREARLGLCCSPPVHALGFFPQSEWQSGMTLLLLFCKVGFPCGSVVKNLPANARDAGSNPGSGRFSLGGHGNPLQCSCLRNLMDREAWRAIVHRLQKSQM